MNQLDKERMNREARAEKLELEVLGKKKPVAEVVKPIVPAKPVIEKS